MKTPLRLLCACLAALAFSSATRAEEAISLNFVNADIESVVKAVSHATGKSFLIDPRVKGTVNLVSGAPVPYSLAVEILGSALRLQGFSLVESRGVFRILPESDAKTQAGRSKVKTKGMRTSGVELTTRVFQLRNESAAQMVPVLRPLIAPNNSITAYPGNNTLVITDYADNLERIEQIIESIDISPDGELEIIPIKYTSAVDIAQTLNRLYGEERPATPESGQRAVILPDLRSNSVLLRSENRGKLARLRTLVATLDQPTSSAGNIHVVRLKHADAVELAQTLRSTLGSGNGEAPATANPPGMANSFATTSTLTQSSAKNGGVVSNGAAATNSANSRNGLQPGSLVQADVATNSLIITAPDAIYSNLRAVIEQLDRRRAQVHIEALIVELTADKASEFGIQWQNVSGNGKIASGTNFGTGGSNIVGLMENLAKAGTTGTAGLAPGLNIGFLSGKNTLSALLRALETDNQANILSTPSVVTLDNETAQIVIGQNVPFLTGAYAQTGNTVSNPFQTYERRDVGLSLRVKPMVTDGGVVRIQIYQEASSLQAASLSNSAGPITNKRALESTVLVDDGNIIVLGGLIDDRYGSGEDKVPLLGDAPLLGGLFRYETKKRSKTNLMVFLRPQIIRDSAGYEKTTAREYDAVIEKQRAFEQGRRSWADNEPSPQLPLRISPSLGTAGNTENPALPK